jgi:hypothetical protein
VSEERTFTQAEVEKIVEERLARAREKFAKESEGLAETGELRQQLAQKDEELATIKHKQFLADAQRDVRDELARRGVTDEGRIQRIMKHVDFSEASDSSFALSQLDDVARDMPELLRPRGAGSRGSAKPVLTQEPPLTREDVEQMSPQEVNSNWSRVSRFLAGHRD